MPEVLKAAAILSDRGVSAEVVSFHSVKPLDIEYLAAAFRRFKLVATIEEHGRIGGLGGAVAEWGASRRHGADGAMQVSFGSDDEFLHEVGSQDYARGRFGLTADSIADRISSVLNAR